MTLQTFTGIFDNHPLTSELIRELSVAGRGKIRVKGLAGSSKAMLVSSIFRKTGIVNMVILPDKEDAAYFYNDLVSITGDKNIFFFPSAYKRSVIYGQSEPANIVLRTGILNFLSGGENRGIIVTYPEALAEKVPGRKTLKENSFVIKKGDRLSPEFIEELLREYRFERVDFVYEPGQYAIRGSITDIFSYSGDMPYRIDFFGDEVESVRLFNTDDQISYGKAEELTVIPDIAGLTDSSPNMPLTGLLPPDSLIWMEEPDVIAGKMNSNYDQALLKEDSGLLFNVSDNLVKGSALIESTGSFRVVETGKQSGTPGVPSLDFHTEPQPAFGKNFDLLGRQIRANQEEGYETVIVSESQSQIDRLKDIFGEISPGLLFTPVLVSLHQGFTDHDLKIVIYTDRQIFDRYHRYRIKGYFARKESIAVKELTGLKPGDYVVHIDHGIGRFGGLEKIEVNGKLQEAIKLVYRDNDILYVPIHSLHRISKYKSGEGQEPRISKLGSGAWQRLKENTKKKVKDIAKDLIKLYASRMASKGFSFSPDSYLQRELEASFLYEDTPDQLKSTLDVKKDMELPHPMDRLICGDVGFGKTEIAIRAAFKAATDSKQTAVLVPTTVLAYQHYRTFTGRLRGFPCNVEYLTRHKKPADQKKILEKLEKGQIDIIIGTHKLVSENVKFKDLGLLIIDEEQRFGVAVKEKLL